ncbi:MAG: glycosyltransferase [Bacteroidota bacterium]
MGIITTWFDRGAAYVSKAFVTALEEDFQVFIYARGGEEFPIKDPKWDGEYVHWGEFIPGGINTQIDLKDFKTWIDENNLDKLIFNEQQSWEVIKWCKHHFKGAIGSYIDYYTEETVPLFRAFDFLVCNTQRHHSVFKHHPNSMYIPWGVDPELFSEKPIEEEHIRFFHSAGFSPYRKGTDLVLEAFSQLQSEAKLIIHIQNPPSNYPELSYYLQTKNVEWVVATVPPPGLYHMGNVYVYPSRLDGLGLSLPEAIASGLFALVPDEAPMKEFIAIANPQNTQPIGKTIPVKSRLKREDGYYWKMNELDVNELAQSMEALAQQWPAVEWNALSIKNAAHQHLNWKENGKGLSQLVKTAAKRQIDTATTTLLDKMIADQSPNFTTKQKIHQALITLGARKLKRALLGRG